MNVVEKDWFNAVLSCAVGEPWEEDSSDINSEIVFQEGIERAASRRSSSTEACATRTGLTRTATCVVSSDDTRAFACVISLHLLPGQPAPSLRPLSK